MLISVAASMNNNIASIRSTQARTLQQPHVHARTHMLRKRIHHINSPTLSPSLASSSFDYKRSNSFKLQLHSTNSPISTRNQPNSQFNMAEIETIDAQKLRLEFLEVLRSRRSPGGQLFFSVLIDDWFLDLGFFFNFLCLYFG